MENNLSKMYGIPASSHEGMRQHKALVENLKNNGVFDIPFQNRGFLVLKVRREGGLNFLQYHNILQNTKPKGKYVTYTKV